MLPNMLALLRQSLPLCREGNPQISLTFVRWRKRRDRPRARSKFFIFNDKKPEDPVEREELIWRRNHYNTQMKAIQKLFTQQFITQGVSASSMTESEALDYEESDFQRMLHYNKEWNAEVAKTREIRTAKEMLDAEARKIGSLEKKETLALQDLMLKEEEVRIMKERAVDFVTKENLDAKIEEVLNTKVDYNFAIDLDGNTHKPSEELFALNSEEMNAKINDFELKVGKPS